MSGAQEREAIVQAFLKANPNAPVRRSGVDAMCLFLQARGLPVTLESIAQGFRALEAAYATAKPESSCSETEPNRKGES
jgi:hypothetical protein